ncbi:MAG: hypothetical protein HFJ55_01830 [Clostridia bacterium]|nr:hypothetical protein [Clostridia bacterium]
MEEEKVKIEKNKIDKRQLITKIMAGFLVAVMVLATCSTFIYYIIANVK